MICSICDEQIVGPSCSAHPINDGRCCWRCDDLIVTPVRLALSCGMNVVRFFQQGIGIHKVTLTRKTGGYQQDDNACNDN